MTQLHDRVVSALGEAYEVGEEIGRGGMGVVYKATDRKLRRAVAIKVLPPELAFRDDVRQRFLREAQTAAQLNHPNIVPIYAVEERDGLVCFVMALVTGESLAARLARERHPPLPDVCRILRGVADALAYAHSRGIVHRDIKPDNILLDAASGNAIVTDFGIARAAEGDVRLTVTGIAVGTPAYMSPEQAMGERDVDGRSDLYSLAVVAYQMLAGELPFRATNTPSMLMKHISDAPDPLRERRPDLPPLLISAVERAMAKKPEDRWTDAAGFRDAITVIESGKQMLGEGVRSSAAPRGGETGGSGHAGGDGGDDRQRISSPWKHRARRVPPEAGDARGGGGGGAGAGGVPNAPPSSEDEQARGVARRARSAVEAANAGWQGGRTDWGAGKSRPPASGPPVPPDARPPVPSWMPPSWNEVRRQTHLAQHGHVAGARVIAGQESLDAFSRLSIADRIRSFRRRTASSAVTVGMLAAINLVFSPGFLWFLFPAFGMSIPLARRLASLWADGVRWKDIFGRDARRALQAGHVPGHQQAALPSPAQLAQGLAPDDVLAGPYGDHVRRAATDRRAVQDAVAKLSKADRALIPDVEPTVNALAERVGALAQALHRIDEDVQPAAIDDLERRIAATREQPESRERDQRLQLLERQRSTMGDLLGRRETLASQLESASLRLQNLRLDLVALRSAGVQAAIDEVSTATQEARALSRDIAHVLDAAREIR